MEDNRKTVRVFQTRRRYLINNVYYLTGRVAKKFIIVPKY